MFLSQHEQERLLIHVAADVAARRRERGLRLNHPEATAVITAFLLEGARDGRTVAELMDAGRRVLTRDDVMDGVPEMLAEVQVEATFPDGTKLVTVQRADLMTGVIAGEVLVGDGDITLNAGRPVTRLAVANTGDRPVQVGSHYHFAEANAALDFDRDAAWGQRLAVPAGTSVRFEPGVPRDVDLVPLGGRRIVPGLRGLAGGPLDPPATVDDPLPDDIEPAGSLDEDDGDLHHTNESSR